MSILDLAELRRYESSRPLSWPTSVASSIRGSASYMTVPVIKQGHADLSATVRCPATIILPRHRLRRKSRSVHDLVLCTNLLIYISPEGVGRHSLYLCTVLCSWCHSRCLSFSPLLDIATPQWLAIDAAHASSLRNESGTALSASDIQHFCHKTASTSFVSTLDPESVCGFDRQDEEGILRVFKGSRANTLRQTLRV